MSSRFKKFFTDIWPPIAVFVAVYCFIVYVVTPLKIWWVLNWF